jgi:iron complex transport system substrate-binding protein
MAARSGWAAVPAVATAQRYKVKAPIILQPGPAALTEGPQVIHEILCGWQGPRQMLTG